MDISRKKISVLGAVRSGCSAAKLAMEMGGIPFVSDMSSNQEILNNVDELAKLGIEFGSEDGIRNL